MHREHLNNIIDLYSESWASGLAPYATYRAEEEQDILVRFRRLLASQSRCFENDCYDPGHITGSALLVSPDFRQVLLTLHRKLNRWLQLGGHSDGQSQPHAAAMREAEEESGLSQLSFLPYERIFPTLEGRLSVPLPFDFDIHDIPARKDTPAHQHFDVRYVIVGDPRLPLIVSEESQDLRWFSIAEAREVTSERSMHRQFDKLAMLATMMG